MIDFEKTNLKLNKTMYQKNFRNTFTKQELVNHKKLSAEKIKRFYAGQEPIEYFKTEISDNGTPRFTSEFQNLA